MLVCLQKRIGHKPCESGDDFKLFIKSVKGRGEKTNPYTQINLEIISVIYSWVLIYG